MRRYYDLLSARPDGHVAGLKNDQLRGRNPRDVKVLLAQELVAASRPQGGR